MEPDLTIIILGNTGAGKSASGNTILGRPAFVSKPSFSSVTKQISEESQTVFGTRITVVDTPGILGHEEEIQALCQRHVNDRCLYLVVLPIDRFTREQNSAVEAALRAIGDKLDRCYLLFTSGDKLGNATLDSFINEVPESPLPQLVGRFSGRCHVFNNDNGGQDQVRQLLEMSGLLLNRSGRRKVRRVVLLGLPRRGKSSAGNTILGSTCFDAAASFNSVTMETVSRSAVMEGRDVTVVDTPGFPNDRLTPRQLFQQIMVSVVKAQPGPHAFIIVVKINEVSEADIKMFKLIRKLFGKHALRYGMVLFTHGDELGDQSMDRLVQENKHVLDLVKSCERRFCVFNNKIPGNREQVRKLLDKIDRMVSANNNDEYYTSAAFSANAHIWQNPFTCDFWKDVVWEVWDKFLSILHEFENVSQPTSAQAGHYRRSGAHFPQYMSIN